MLFSEHNINEGKGEVDNGDNEVSGVERRVAF